MIDHTLESLDCDATIDTQHELSLRTLMLQLGVSRETLHRVIAIVGPRLDDVKRCIRHS